MSEPTTFLNVDLEVLADYDLSGLAKALEVSRRCFVVDSGPWWQGGYHASFELARASKTPDSTIRGLARLVSTLPSPTRRLWTRARRRFLSIGIQAGHEPRMFEAVITQGALRAALEINAEVVLTIYGACPPFEGDRSCAPAVKQPRRSSGPYKRLQPTGWAGG
jgi:hypothetical protein